MIARAVLAALLAIALSIFALNTHAQVGQIPGWGPVQPPPANGSIVVTDLGHNSNTSATVALTGLSVPANSLIVVGTTDDAVASSGGSVSDSASNSYTSIASGAINNNTNHGFGTLWYFNNNSAPLTSITLTKVGAEYGVISAFYATGILSSGALDTGVTASAYGSSSSPSVTGSGAAVSGELNVGWVVSGYGTGSFTTDTGHGWALPLDADVALTYSFGGGGHLVNAGTSGKIFNPALGASAEWAAFIASFKP